MDRIARIDFHGQPALHLTTRNGASAIVTCLGAQVVSWQPAGGGERLFLSKAADFTGQRAIRGGIPVCWPQFAEQGRLPKHGLVRCLPWRVADERVGDGFALVSLAITDSDATRALWPYAFELELSILIEDSRLAVELEVLNSGHGPFVFTSALHTYLAVGEVEEARLEGLANSHYRDKTRGGQSVRDSGDHLQLSQETDRIYSDVSNALLLRDGGRNLAIHGEGFPDVVVWNPWLDKAQALPDLEVQEFRRMLCVEAAATQAVELGAGEEWLGRQTLVAL